jgi:hypothetical protein
MKLLYDLKILTLTICALTLLISVTYSSASGEEKLSVTGTYRLTHPAYYMANKTLTDGNVFNLDNTKILLWEGHIDGATAGEFMSSAGETRMFPVNPIWPLANSVNNPSRQTIWGNIETLKACNFDNLSLSVGSNSGLACWRNNTYKIGQRVGSMEQLGRYPKWSTYPGEEDILFGICQRSDTGSICKINPSNGLPSESGTNYAGWLVAIDTSKNPGDAWYLTPLIYIDSAATYPYMDVHSITKDGHVIVNRTHLNSTAWSGYGYRVNLDRRSPKVYGTPNKGSLYWIQAGISLADGTVVGACNVPEGENQWIGVHGSLGFLPTGKYLYSGSGTVRVEKCEYNAGTGLWYNGGTWQLDPSYSLSNGIWARVLPYGKYSLSWFIAADYNSDSPYNQYPNIWTTGHIYQVLFDETTHKLTVNPLLDNMHTAALWDIKGEGSSVTNYENIPHPSLSQDNTIMRYQRTNGKYTSFDKALCAQPAHSSKQNCDTLNANTDGKIWEGAGTYIAYLAPTSGAQACNSYTYSAWSECQPSPTGSGQGTQTRIVTSSSPADCTGGTPVLTQSCTYNPGAAANNILKTTSTPTIDGNLGEYALVNPFTFSPSSGGNTVTVRTLWNSEALYLGINVTDSQLNASATTRDGSVWSDDSVEWFIDTYNDGGGSTTPSSTFMRTDDYHGIVNILNTKYDSQGTTSGTPSSSWNGTWQSAVKMNGSNNNNSDSDTGYTIEIKIPWTSIGYSSAPTTDTLVGLSFAVNDKDASGITSLMSPNITTAFENASKWQSVMLSGSLAIIDSTPPAPPMALIVQ